MATMGKYCKAYPLTRLEEWPEWKAKVKPNVSPARTGDADKGETYAFLQENYTATTGVFIDQDILFDDVTQEWIRFCNETLQFEPSKFSTASGQSSAPSRALN